MVLSSKYSLPLKGDKTMNIDNILEFFYEKASKRVNDKIKGKDEKILHSQIYKDDPKQISWIINNNRTKNNRFLICDAVLGNSIDDKLVFEYGLIPKLGFANRKEVLWGSDREINLYLPELFRLLWDEVTTDPYEYEIDKELFLCDYIPYAKNSVYWNILFSQKNIFPAMLYGIREDDVINNIDSSREEAFRYLYHRCENSFKEIFKQFASSTRSFHRINKIFKDEFIDILFIDMLTRYKPAESSLGLRVRSLITADLSNVAMLIHEYNVNETINDISRQLNNASSTYIILLEKIQKEMVNNQIYPM